MKKGSHERLPNITVNALTVLLTSWSPPELVSSLINGQSLRNIFVKLTNYFSVHYLIPKK